MFYKLALSNVTLFNHDGAFFFFFFFSNMTFLSFLLSVSPRMALPLRNQSLLVGHKLNLTCSVAGDPFPTVAWLKDNSTIPSRIQLSPWNRSLVISNVGINDEGTYTCQAENRAGRASSTAHVEVKGLRNFYSSSQCAKSESLH